ncbi:MAG: cyclic nucleotide-binding domain-containing protein [Gammaproteobacteria bacterium]|nr:cyclic nucleotide-binding domain-containing protein [Gammaproteobacteria bacterium]
MGMMFEQVAADYDIVIVGSGPAGLAAASRAAERGNRHVLLEAEHHAADTIYQYQKGKHVMAEPGYLPLRSGLAFAEGRREEILFAWDEAILRQGINIAYGHKVSAIKRAGPDAAFEVDCENGKRFTARTVVLGIGLQGNPRKLGVPGEDDPRVQYTLADPEAFKGEAVVVVGAGDAGIENACALAARNEVHLMNRSEEFTRCKDGNRKLVNSAEKAGRVRVWHSSFPERLEATPDGRLAYVFNTKDGQHNLPCDRVIARLGAIPPRKLVESFGVIFPNPNPEAIPDLSETYESNVPGLFIVGALGGCPLIKQAMNQGYEVVETINGSPVEPADEPLIRERLQAWMALAEPFPGAAPLASSPVKVGEVIERIRSLSPFLADITPLQMRELLLESTLHVHGRGSTVFAEGDYTNTFFTVLRGNAWVLAFTLGPGSFFGEMGLISGRRRTATVSATPGCVLMETPRRTILKLIASSAGVARRIDQAFLGNAVRHYFGKAMSAEALANLIGEGVPVRRFQAGQILFKEGDEADGLYLIRRGSVAVTRGSGERAQVMSHMGAGEYFGEMALLTEAPRSATVTATVLTEVLVLEAARLKAEVAHNEALRKSLQEMLLDRVRMDAMRQEQVDDEHSAIAHFFMRQGAGEASNMLVIDETLCIQCNNCEIACAESHQGVSRLRRETGPTFAHLHIAEACRHCEQPYCMKDCPPDAISRSASGEVFISDACIGCGNCESNCPYGAVTMTPRKPAKWGGGWLWLLFGLGKAPGNRAPEYDPEARKVAAKCDLCRDLKGGPRCVSSCPTGAAQRVSAKTLFETLGKA